MPNKSTSTSRKDIEKMNGLDKEMSRHTSMIEGMARSLDNVRRSNIQADEQIYDLQ